MRVVLAIAVPLLAALLQGSVVPLIAIGGVRPSLVILVAGSWALAAGAREAVWWAFIGALASDLISGGPLGALPLAALPAVAAIGLGDPARPAGVLAGAGTVGIAALMTTLLYLGILAVTTQAFPSLSGLLRDAGGGAVYTALLAIGMYPLARLVYRRSDSQRAFGV